MLEKPEQSRLTWEKLDSGREDQKWYHTEWEVYRAKVPGGWLVLPRSSGTIPQHLTFYPDPEHKWDGGSLP